jgi:hypothetical protein
LDEMRKLNSTKSVIRIHTNADHLETGRVRNAAKNPTTPVYKNSGVPR